VSSTRTSKMVRSIYILNELKGKLEDEEEKERSRIRVSIGVDEDHARNCDFIIVSFFECKH
jgi:hypothetical protein